ncbi:LOW QUALITY PROTEIN: phage baseplate [Geomicrobium sp. JCM 19039]|nr:LOW QUALITY PROTEIN: phage baseplate [Geomicrobium sp. JCM 19039]
MFENETFPVIMERMLERLPDDLDKREGSIIWKALAASAVEQAQAYIWMDIVLEQIFADTASGEFLDRRAGEVGVERNSATRAIRRASFNTAVEEGERFLLRTKTFILLLSQVEMHVECETVGTAGNAFIEGQPMLPVDNIPGLESAVIGEVLIPGQSEESDESLFERYQTRARREAASANKAHYKQWLKKHQGVGQARVFPLADGDGTVSVVILNADNGPASQELVEAAQEYIDPVPRMGEGQAPVGALATVRSAEVHTVDISANVALTSGYDIEDAEEEIQGALVEFFRSIAFNDDVVRISSLNNLFFSATSIVDYADVRINGSTENLQLSEREIPQLGEVNLDV